MAGFLHPYNENKSDQPFWARLEMANWKPAWWCNGLASLLILRFKDGTSYPSPKCPSALCRCQSRFIPIGGHCNDLASQNIELNREVRAGREPLTSSVHKKHTSLQGRVTILEQSNPASVALTKVLKSIFLSLIINSVRILLFFIGTGKIFFEDHLVLCMFFFFYVP